MAFTGKQKTVLKSALMLIAMNLCIKFAWSQSNPRQPHIGYLYPAGAQQGSVVKILACGQYLGNVKGVYISGEGVSASVIKYYRVPRNLQNAQRLFLMKKLNEVEDKRLAELPGKRLFRIVPRNKKINKKSRQKVKSIGKVKRSEKGKNGNKKNDSKKSNAAKTLPMTLPDIPLLYDLENKSLRDLANIRSIIFFPRKKKQMNRQLAESVMIEITVDKDAVPGDRELRICTKVGLTNPVIFQVGLLPEVCECEPNNSQAYPDLSKLLKVYNLPKEKPLQLPVQLNGQVLPGDIDRFRFHAREGQKLVIECHARSLIPYMADAVPGWLQATLALYDAKNNEVAFVDDYRFNPDPVLFYKVPKDGDYEIEIRDALYRGREDFVYRLSVSEQPFITSMFPLGGMAGTKTVASLSGWNLPRRNLRLNTLPAGPLFRHTAIYRGKRFSNTVPYEIDTLPESFETESNDTIKEAQPIELPMIINGRIERPGDVDMFQFKGHAGDKIVAEVYGRRLNSPLDSLLRLMDGTGKVLKWNDDYVVKEHYLFIDRIGLITHHADSYLLAELPRDGKYYVQLLDVEHHGGSEYGYRLRVSAPQIDFALRVTPSSLYVRSGGVIPVTVYALRKDGFKGDIRVRLKNAPAGFEIEGGLIPAGCDRIRMTLTVPVKDKGADQPVFLELEGIVRTGSKTVRRNAVPADEVMQAFLYRHIVPAKEFLVLVQKSKWRMPPVHFAGNGSVRIPIGGMALVRINTWKSKILQELKLELNKAPDGVSIHDVSVVPKGLLFHLKADKDVLKSGFTDNLIVEAFRVYKPKLKNGKLSNTKRRYSFGFFPAIPIKIVK